MNHVDVSIIVCTYNSDIEKLKKTLFSAILQKNINFEIVITDDGSDNFNENALENFFEKYGFENYKIIRHTTNMGTVSNYYDGLVQASGEYIYGISPGDYFYNSTVISELYNFCIKNNINMCFGEAVSYEIVNDEVVLKKALSPKWPYSFLKSIYNPNIALISFLFGHQPIGATYFRKKNIAIKYFGKIKNKVKYLEDYPTTALFLLDGMKLYYFRKPVVWYECNTGISTCKSIIWRERLEEDSHLGRSILFQEHGNNNILQAVYVLRERIKHPLVCMIGLIVKILGGIRYKTRKNNCIKRYFYAIVQYDVERFTEE